jgi:hypothetical protein
VFELGIQERSDMVCVKHLATASHFPWPDANVVSKSDTSPPTLAELLRELATELATLLRQELTLARIEVSQSLTVLFSSLGALVTGFAMLYAGFLLLLVAAVFGLATLVPVWLAALGVGLLISLAGGRSYCGDEIISRQPT